LAHGIIISEAAIRMEGAEWRAYGE
jgi:hypothetical protein